MLKCFVKLCSECRFLPPSKQKLVKNTSWGKMRRVGIANEGAVFLVEFYEGTPHGWHFHPQHREIIFVISGKIEQKVERRKTVLLEAGSSVEIGVGRRHTARPIGKTPAVVMVILFGEGNGYEAEDCEPPRSRSKRSRPTRKSSSPNKPR